MASSQFAYFLEEHLFFLIYSYECSLPNLSRIYATPPFNNRLCLPIFYLNWFGNPVKSKEFYLCILFLLLGSSNQVIVNAIFNLSVRFSNQIYQVVKNERGCLLLCLGCLRILSISVYPTLL